MELFNQNQCVGICLKNTNEYVRLAVEDLRNDFKRISESGVCPELLSDETKPCIVIEENTASDEDPIKNEGYSITAQDGIIRISAKGYLGTMWAIYTFCERFLGVDPCYLFADFQPQKLSFLEMPDTHIIEEPRGFGFRGVFINDEDLLTGWKDGGLIRYVDFPWYSLTVDKSAIDMVVETVLRLKLNLVIPASLLDIDNFGEKLLADSVAKRGIYLSQHHIEPVGVSSFTFNNYCFKNNISARYSYLEHPHQLEDAWEYYAKKWAQYPNVVWQIGLRGAGDRPVWQEDIPSLDELRKYGKIISGVYEKQIEIISKATQGRARHFTTTLWMEGSVLMEKGFLKIPQCATVVFADVGLNQMYGKEYYNFERNEKTKRGIYYHLQFFGSGPHLAPQTGIRKLCYNTKLAYDNGDNAYYIMNASNVREFVFELGAYSKMVWDTKGFNEEAYINDYSKKFGTKKECIKNLIYQYYDSMPFLEGKYLENHYHGQYFNFYTEDNFEGFKNFILKEGDILEQGMKLVKNFHCRINIEMSAAYYDALKISIPKYENICKELQILTKSLEYPLVKHLEVKWLLYAKTLLYIYDWYVCVYEAKLCCDLYDSENMKRYLNQACESLEDYLEYRKCGEYGIFENWYRGDLKLNIKQKLADTRRLLGQTTGIA